MTSENQPPDGDFSTPKQEAPELGLDFLAGLLRGKVHLTAIHDNKPMKARIVSDCNERDETWVKDLNEAHYNIYFTPNLVRDEFKGLKPAKSDITSARVLHVDIDDASELTRQKIKGFEPKPSLVVFSGGGYHLYWLLSEFSEKFELVEKINASLAKLFGGDAACHNIDRLMRLPLTTNWPNAKKRKSGRTPSAAFVDLGLGNPAARYKLDDIANLPDAALPPEGSLNAPMPEKFRIRGIEAAELLDSDPLALILTLGDDPERPRHQIGGRFPSRSEADWFVTCELLRLGLHPEVVLGILLNPTLGISERFLEKPKPEEAAWRQILKARAMVEKGWPERRKDGRPIRSLLNALEACVRLEIIFEFDRFHNRKRVGGHSLQEFVGDLSDDVVAHLHGLIIDTFGFDPGKGHLMDAVHILCLQRSFHPIREYLSELEWDGAERVDTWLIDYLGAEDTALNRAIGKIVLVAAVRRVRQPGVKFDTMMVLEGPQGSGKSTALVTLAGEENFSDQNVLALDDKGQMEIAEGVWILEISELDGMNRSETTKVKAYQSRTEDRGRPGYGRFKPAFPKYRRYSVRREGDSAIRIMKL